MLGVPASEVKQSRGSVIANRVKLFHENKYIFFQRDCRASLAMTQNYQRQKINLTIRQLSFILITTDVVKLQGSLI